LEPFPHDPSDSDDEPFATLVPEPTEQVVENLELVEETDDRDKDDSSEDNYKVVLEASAMAASVEVIELDKHGKEVKKSINFKDKCWARFPPEEVMSNQDLIHAQRGLPFLNELFPLSKNHTLLEPSAHAFHGEILMQHQLQESLSEGMGWMRTAGSHCIRVGTFDVRWTLQRSRCHHSP
jgi:hypothetical protein